MKKQTWQDFENTGNRANNTPYDHLSEQQEKDFLTLKAQLIKHLDKLAKQPCDRGCFTDYEIWADILHEKVIDFYNERGIYPNILLANNKTYDKITEYEKDKPENRVWEGEGLPEEFDGFSAFSTKEYCLEFCVNNRLKVNNFRLIYDENPTFDGEEVMGNDAQRYLYSA